MSVRLRKMKELATIEAKNLKKLSTKAEKSRLNASHISPYDQSKCIYGMMTSDCYSKRANFLIQKCCTRGYSSDVCKSLPNSPLNGKPFDTEKRAMYYHSPIEMLIFSDNGGREAITKLVAYIKGETKTLKL